MAMIDIPSLFRDVLETPQQRQQRQMQEGMLRGQQMTSRLGGLAATQAPLIQTLYRNMPARQDALRRGVGGMLGLDVRTESEKLSDILKTADTSSPSGMVNLSKAIQEYAPAQALQLRQAAASQQAEARAAAAQAELTRLQTLNELAEAEQRRQTEAARLETEAREQTERESLRAGLKGMVQKQLTALGPSNLLDDYLNRIDGGQYDSVEGARLLLEELYPEDEIVNAGGTALYNKSTGEYILPPPTDPSTGAALDVSPDKYYAASIGRYNTQVRRIQNNPNLTPTEKFEQIQASAPILKWRLDNHKLQEVTRTVNGEEVTDYIPVPTGELVAQTQDKVDALNSRKRAAFGRADAGLTSVSRIREEINKANANEESITGGFVDVALSYVAGQPQYELRLNVEQLEGVMGLTGLAEARLGSATGASGFGALSAPELQLLKDRVAALRIGQSYDQFMQSLSLVEETLSNMARENATPITYNQYIGLEPRPQAENLDFTNVTLD